MDAEGAGQEADTVPEGFNIHRTSQAVMDAAGKMIEGAKTSTGRRRALAFASLVLDEGFPGCACRART
jgi:2-oxoglutarate dehydrogenase complex dehydrogenase (E1) component-like enzyme